MQQRPKVADIRDERGHDEPERGSHEEVVRPRRVPGETRLFADCHHRGERQDPLARRPHRRGGRCRKSLAGDFDAQCRQTFRNIEKTLAQAGAKLSDLVTMTVFLIDARYTTRMTELRVEIFSKDFPASAAITVAGFAQPEMMIEI